MVQFKQRIALLGSIAALGLAAALTTVLAIHNRAAKPVTAEPATMAAPLHPPAPAPSETTLKVETPTVDVASLPVATGASDGKRAHSGASATLHPLGAPPAPVSKSSKADCIPPFVVDDKGHKHYKPACL
jgi:hypothetical protein